jgi:glycosyltransferase involved in cell wall biosynthesis
VSRVAVFTDNDFGKVNGVTTTLKALVRHAPADVRPRIYTLSDFGIDEPDYLALRSFGVPIPFYPEMAMYLPRLRLFRRHLAADGVRLLHLTTPGPAGLAVRYLLARSDARLVGSFHTQLAEYALLLSGSSLLSTAMRYYLRWLYGTCERVLVPSDDTRERLASDGWPRERLAVWPHGVDVETFSPLRRSAALRERWHVSDRRPALLYAGRVSREKGLSLLAPLLSSLHDRRVAHRLVVVGDGPMMAEIREACPDAFFTGRLPHDQVAVAMASADLFVFPSATDTAGNVVLEAQACGLPVVVSDQGGPHQNMVAGESGAVCRTGNVADFCDRIAALIEPERRARMACAARRFAEGRTWEMSLAPVYSLYRAVLARQPEPGAAPRRTPGHSPAGVTPQ